MSNRSKVRSPATRSSVATRLPRALRWAALLATLMACELPAGPTPAGGAPSNAPGAPGAAAPGATTPGATAPGSAAANDPSVPAPFRAFYNVTSVSTDATSVVIRTTDVPDHKSPFFGKASPQYEAYNGDNPSFNTAINLMGMISDPTLKAQDITLRIPKNPKAAATHTATGLGAIGVAVNGVVLYNQYNGRRALLDSLEFNNMDQYGGHPTPAPALQYHYHVEPTHLTKTLGADALMGYLLDGFPVYGPEENGARLRSADLDAYHGHEHPTPEYPSGIYHYHFTDDAPWLNGDAYYGTPGTATR